jgi:hypothetical protein
MPRFKYADAFENCSEDCPPTNAIKIERVGFRFVFNPIDADSFEIPARRDPDRFAATPSCPQCGLSMFLSAEMAAEFFERKKRKHPRFAELLGDHLAEIALMPDCGVQTEADEDGHFALYEYESVDLASIAVMIGPL